MDRVLVVCLLVALAGCSGLAGDPEPTGPAVESGDAATVTEVVDGDTIKVRYEDGTTDTVRLLGIDTPEVRGSNDPSEFEGVPDTEAGRTCLGLAGEEASDALRDRIAGGRVGVVVDETADRRDRYGRLLAYVELEGTDLNHWLVAEGHTRVYDTTFDRSAAYYEAESTAREERVGVWTCRTPETDEREDAGLTVAEMQADAPGNDHEDLNGEYVVFENAGNDTLAIGDWTVSDETGTTYTFPGGDQLAPDERVRLFTGEGEDGPGERYWGQDRAVWNNGGDTVFVRDDGRLVLSWAY